ncbi:retinol dehydrogenase 13-like isoform X2 [Procambarus clarkii]|uniref:retinol dehydrogenase 13-like isoform X2 n=1 Tax=Procambarus clarkii TaxID=6728 RepID=UPI00374418CF
MIWVLWVALTTTAAVGLAVRLGYRYQSGRCSSRRKLLGQTVIITGASAGIGKETARDLARRGARVILACRNTNKAQKVADDIIRTTGNRKVEVRQLDTSDLSSVRKFAEDILATEKALHVLMNNAAILPMTEKKLTTDGLELTMATNHFGHFLLTNMLLGLLKASAPSRIINVTSRQHLARQTFDPDDLNYEKTPYPGCTAVYGDTKLATVLFTVELSRKLRDTRVTANSVHPGVVSTEILNKGGGTRLLPYYFGWPVWLMGKDAELGAQTLIYLAVSEEVDGISGKYFVDCKESKTNDLAKDPVLAKRLWDASERLVKMKPEETHC